MANEPDYYYPPGEAETAAQIFDKMQKFAKACKVMELEARRIVMSANSKGMDWPPHINYILHHISFDLRNLEAEIEEMLKR